MALLLPALLGNYDWPRPGHKEVILRKNCLPNNPSFPQWIIFVLSEDYSDVFSTYLISRIAGEVESIILDPVTQTSVHLPPVVPATGRTTHPIILVIPSIILYNQLWCVESSMLEVCHMYDWYIYAINEHSRQAGCNTLYMSIYLYMSSTWSRHSALLGIPQQSR